MDQVPAEDSGQEPEQHPDKPQDVRPGPGGGDCPPQQHLPQHMSQHVPIHKHHHHVPHHMYHHLFLIPPPTPTSLMWTRLFVPYLDRNQFSKFYYWEGFVGPTLFQRRFDTCYIKKQLWLRKIDKKCWFHFNFTMFKKFHMNVTFHIIIKSTHSHTENISFYKKFLLVCLTYKLGQIAV